MKKYNISNMSFIETFNKMFNGKGLLILCCTLSDIMMAESDSEVYNAMKHADILTPDGMPLVWWLKYKTGKSERVYGPDLLKKFLTSNFQFPIKQLFVGDEKNKKYFKKYGNYVVLPIKDVFDKNDIDFLVKKIEKYKSKIVWVGLGSRKQIIVADQLKKRLPNLVYVTVGAAFDFLSGNKKQAPIWMQQSGLEWLFRLMSEPRRLGKRYFKIIIFVISTLLFHNKFIESILFTNTGSPGTKK